MSPDLPMLADALRGWLEPRAVRLGLDPARAKVEYVLNWGGWTNASFRLSDGRKTFHAKIAADADAQTGLRRWQQVNRILETRYHAPRVIERIDLPGVDAEGLLFEHVAGESPKVIPRAVANELEAMLVRLRGDEVLVTELARIEGPDRATRTCADAFLASYGARFDGDLEEIEATPPAFVSAETVGWMRREADALVETVRTSRAFSEPAGSPVHGDLWSQNVLVKPDGSWCLLDWDDLSLGDPALDLAMLRAASSPVLDARRPPVESPSLPDAILRERLELYARAILLDWIIDPLADWIEADASPEHAEEVRAEKRCIHEENLARYRDRYVR